MTAAAAVVAPFRCFEVDVVRVERLSPCFVRVGLGGDALRHFDGGGPDGPRDLRIKLLVPRPGGAVARIDDFSPGWYPRWLGQDPLVRGEMRTYTVRRARCDGPRPEIDVDLVLHAPSGPASSWAASVTAGDRVLLLGPSAGHLADYGGIEWAPPAAAGGELLLVGDESAVPAIASILETLPAAYAGRAIVEVPASADILDVHSDADVELTWLPRGRWPRGALLDPLLAHLERPAYAWVAGEAAMVRRVRRRLVRAGMPKDAITFLGYWREGGPL